MPIKEFEAERFEEIQSEILELLDEAKRIVQSTKNTIEIERMRGYWLAQIQTAVSKDHDYVSSSMFTMENTATFLNSIAEDEEEESDEEDES